MRQKDPNNLENDFCLHCLLHGPGVEVSGLSAAEPPNVVGFLNAGDSLRHVWVDNLATVQILS